MIRPFRGTFPITQIWGINKADYARFGLEGHNGVDYGTPTGTPIIAPHNGKVIEAAFDKYGYGMYVKIENEVEGSILGHLESFNVNAGDTVFEGQQIGISDNTGNSTGPHLHWGYYRMPRNKADGYSGTTNPWPHLTENQTVVESPIESKELQDIIRERDRLNRIIGDKDEELRTLRIEMNHKLAEKEQECQDNIATMKEEIKIVLQKY